MTLIRINCEHASLLSNICSISDIFLRSLDFATALTLSHSPLIMLTVLDRTFIVPAI